MSLLTSAATNEADYPSLLFTAAFGSPEITPEKIGHKVLCEHQDSGRAKVTGLVSDAGKFATPSLRNIALTAPYMHDGRFTTLAEVVAHYSTGLHRSATLDPNLAKHPDGGIRLSAEDQEALVAFLQTLTDEKFSK